MQNSLESNSQTSVARRKKLIVIFIAGLLILLVFIPIATLKPSIGNSEPPTLVMRVDDVQDFAFREAQLFLLNESVINKVPLSLAVIAGMFGEDKEIVQTAKHAVSLGSEVTVHGWEHENLAELPFEEQVVLLSQSRSQIKEILDYDVEVLVPPMFSYNEDTVAAMHEEGYTVISTLVEFDEPGSTLEVTSLPATVELSDFSNGTWNMESSDTIEAEISKSIQEYGFAVIVTHPQEFIEDGELNQGCVELYRTLIITLKENYSFKTLEGLSETSYADKNEGLSCVLR